jgi:hypothetical protein
MTDTFLNVEVYKHYLISKLIMDDHEEIGFA